MFCGPKAFPVSFPLLSKAEVASIVGNLTKPIYRATIDGQEVEITLIDHFRRAAGPMMMGPGEALVSTVCRVSRFAFR